MQVGVRSSEDRAAILKAIHRFVSTQRDTRVLPTAPVLEECERISIDVTPTAPLIHEIEEPTSSTSGSVLINECVICMEKQVRNQEPYENAKEFFKRASMLGVVLVRPLCKI